MSSINQMIDGQIATIRNRTLNKPVTMSVEIIQVEPGKLLSVNGKIVRKDMDGNWIAQQELKTTEERFLKEYLAMAEEVAPVEKATYKS